jgi:CubicO group peptidase (beta-lactamase class C family)
VDPYAGYILVRERLGVRRSTIKGIASAAMALARSRGLFAYDDRVADHWPAFGQQAKAGVTVRDLLGHRAGVAAIEETLTPAAIADRTSLMERLAAKPPDWEPGRRRGYHAWSLGWYESELLRRTDPAGRTLGCFLAEEIADPLGLELYVGLPDDVPGDRVAEIRGFSPLAMVGSLGEFPPRMVLALLNPRSVTSRALSPFAMRTPAELNDPAYRSLEIPGGNGIAFVRDVAKLYGLLATGSDDLDVDDDTLDRLAATPGPPAGGRRDVVLKTDTSYSLGYWKPFDGFRFGSPRAFGAPGAGGSFGFADPARELGFAYAPNRRGTSLRDDPRERALRDAVVECVDRC